MSLRRRGKRSCEVMVCNWGFFVMSVGYSFSFLRFSFSVASDDWWIMHDG